MNLEKLEKGSEWRWSIGLGTVFLGYPRPFDIWFVDDACLQVVFCLHCRVSWS
jgi:hypothetical protein